MKKILLLIISLLIGCALVSSCQKDSINNLVGTWDYMDGSGDYIVITKTTLTFFYGDGNGIDHGVPYEYKYESPHLFIMGVNMYDIVSISKDTMTWQLNMGDEKELFKLKRR